MLNAVKHLLVIASLKMTNRHLIISTTLEPFQEERNTYAQIVAKSISEYSHCQP